MVWDPQPTPMEGVPDFFTEYANAKWKQKNGLSLSWSYEGRALPHYSIFSITDWSTQSWLISPLKMAVVVLGGRAGHHKTYCVVVAVGSEAMISGWRQARVCLRVRASTDGLWEPELAGGPNIWFLAIIYFVLGCLQCLLPLVRPLYRAMRNESAHKIGWFFLFYMVHIAFCVYVAVSSSILFVAKR